VGIAYRQISYAFLLLIIRGHGATSRSRARGSDIWEAVMEKIQEQKTTISETINTSMHLSNSRLYDSKGVAC